MRGRPAGSTLCWVDGCQQVATREVDLPGGDSMSLTRLRPGHIPDDVESYERVSLFVCEPHAEQLGWCDPDGPYVVVELEQAEGWRLVVEFTSKPTVNPLVLYPPGSDVGGRA